ncbi:MAG: hypothetical protein AAF467_21730 [Actinomycetota bacterium]
MNQPLSRSVVIIVALHALAAVAFGSMVYLAPGNQFPDLVSGGELISDDAQFATGLYANRNIGVGLALVIGLVLRSRLVLLGLMAARFITDVGDLVMSLTTQDLGGGGGVVGQVVFFAILFASELWVIRRLWTAETATSSPAPVRT